MHHDHTQPLNLTSKDERLCAEHKDSCRVYHIILYTIIAHIIKYIYIYIYIYII